MILLLIVTAVAVVVVTVAGMLFVTGSRGTSRRPSNDTKARCKEPATFAEKSEDFKEWLFMAEETIAILHTRNPVGYATSFLEGSAR